MKARGAGFSLVEVVVAVGVFVVGVVGAIALLSSTTTQSSQTRDVLTGTRVAESTLDWLRSQSTDTLAAAVTAGEAGAFWSDRDGTRFSWAETLPEAERYYALEVATVGDLVEEDDRGQALATRYLLRVRWPVWQGVGQATYPAQMDELAFNFAAPR